MKATPLSELDYPDFKNPFFENVLKNDLHDLPCHRLQKRSTGVRTGLLSWSLKWAPLSFRVQSAGKGLSVCGPVAERVHYAQLSFICPDHVPDGRFRKRGSEALLFTERLIHLLRFDSISVNSLAKLVGEQEIVPAQRKLADQVVMELPRFSMNAGLQGCPWGRYGYLLAFNLNKYESLLGQYSSEAVNNNSATRKPSVFLKQIRKRLSATK